MVIIPVPESCTEYYIIGTKRSISVTTVPEPYYIRLDYSASFVSGNQTGYGDYIPYGSPVQLVANTNYAVHSSIGELAVSQLNSHNKRTLFYFDGDFLFSFEISHQGISSGIVLPLTLHGSTNTAIISEMELFQDNHGDMTLAFYGHNTHSINIVQFFTTGASVIYDFVVGANNDHYHGLEFSPNGQYLYCTKESSPYIECYDLLGNNISLSGISSASSYKNSFIELDYDGNLVLAASTHLATISNSNNPGSITWDGSNSSLNFGVGLNPTYPDVRVLPDQVDGEDYGTPYNATRQCCNYNTEWDAVDDIVAPTGTYTWNSSSNPVNGGASASGWVKNQIIIPDGADITISDMTLHFGLSGKVIIQAGGKLTIEGTTLTGNDQCENMWQGVEIYGSGLNGSSSLSDDGQFYMKEDGSNNPSMIEQAINGITTNVNGYGGHFECIKGLFVNCYHSILDYYHNKNVSDPNIIENCTFQKDNTGLWFPYENQDPQMFVVTYEIPGTKILFNSNNGSHNTFNGADLGVIVFNCTGVNLSNAIFENCKLGAVSWSLGNTIPSNNIFAANNFSDCHTSIKLLNSRFDNIVGNTFNSGVGTQTDNFYGVFIDAADGFHITDNVFNNLTYGIWSNNTGSIGGRISSSSGDGNQFIDCWRGVNCTGDNRNLTIKCNQFDNSHQGSNFSIAWYVGGDLGNQGSTSGASGPAGNQFYRYQNRTDFVVDPGINDCSSDNFCYVHHNGSSYTPLKYNNSQSVDITNSFINPSPGMCQGQQIIFSGATEAEMLTAIENEEDPMIQQTMVNELVGWHLENDEELDDLISFLISRDDAAANKMLFSIYMHQQEYEDAGDILSEFDNENEEDQAFYTINSIILSIGEGERTIIDLSFDEKSILEDLKAGTTSQAALASEILYWVYNEPKPEWESADSSEERLGKQYIVDENKPNVHVFPNPLANDELFVKNIESLHTENINLTLSDLLGQKVFSRDLITSTVNNIPISIKGLKNGVYIVEIDNLEGESIFDKLIINR